MESAVFKVKFGGKKKSSDDTDLKHTTRNYLFMVVVRVGSFGGYKREENESHVPSPIEHSRKLMLCDPAVVWKRKKGDFL